MKRNDIGVFPSTTLVEFLRDFLCRYGQQAGASDLSRAEKITEGKRIVARMGPYLTGSNAEAHGRRSRTVQPLVGSLDSET
jgi:hypothetical protein